MVEIVQNQMVDGRYRILSRLGSGGMADVWCAEDTHLQRRVALKVLHHRFAQDKEFVERFRREAEAAAGLQHPNVVGVFDRGSVDGTYYIAMEYIEGRSLKELIDAGLSPSEAVGFVRQILEAARFAHRRGVIHRDLKPQNVIVDSEGKATVTDFGIARAGVSEITQTGSVMGTAHYLSPEQAQGLEVTASSDLYSIGVILYEALTGQVPFEGDSAVAVALKQVSQAPRRPSAVSREVPPALDAVVMRALAKEPERRFRDADAFIAALEAAERAPEQTPPGTDTQAYAALPPVAGPAEAPPGAPAGAIVVAEEEPLADEEERRRRRRWILVGLAVLIGALAGFALQRDTTTEVPQVTGEELEVAIELLRDKGFEIGEVTRVKRDLLRGTVIETSPPAGDTSLDCAFLSFFCDKPDVSLTVSAGPGKAKVPPVIGLPREQAEGRLERAGFAVAVETRSSDEFAIGIVLGSDPDQGELAKRGSTVTLIVSSGPRLVTVPAVVGDQRAAAVEKLRAVGLRATVTEQESDQEKGMVLSQDPGAGSRVEEGITVALIVSSGVDEVTVPNVIGDLRPDAVSTLRNLGLDVVVEEQRTDVEAQDGRVTDQFPPPGTEAREGDTVTITVGDFEEPPPPPTTTTPEPPPGDGGSP